jgi:hypothetical protein
MLAILPHGRMIQENPPMDPASIAILIAMSLICVVFPLLGLVIFWFKARGSFLAKLGWSLLILQPLVGLFFFNEVMAKCGLKRR